jgi:hypothetical protein
MAPMQRGLLQTQTQTQAQTHWQAAREAVGGGAAAQATRHPSHPSHPSSCSAPPPATPSVLSFLEDACFLKMPVLSFLRGVALTDQQYEAAC